MSDFDSQPKSAPPTPPGGRAGEDPVTIARRLIAEGKTEKARVALQGVLAVDPRNRTALEALGHLFMSSEDYSGAAAHFAMMSQVFPGDPNPHNDQGVAHFLAGDNEGAVTQFGRAVELNPNVAVYLANLGKALLVSGQAEEARGYLNRALSLADDKMAAELRGLIEANYPA